MLSRSKMEITKTNTGQEARTRQTPCGVKENISNPNRIDPFIGYFSFLFLPCMDRKEIESQVAASTDVCSRQDNIVHGENNGIVSLPLDILFLSPSSPHPECHEFHVRIFSEDLQHFFCRGGVSTDKTMCLCL